MQARGILFAIAGFLAMLLACCFYLKFGPMSLGEPTALWAEISFYPGILVGRFLFLDVNLTVNQSICGGVLAMSLIGAVIGGICGMIVRSKKLKQVHNATKQKTFVMLSVVVLWLLAFPSIGLAQYNDKHEATPESIQQYLSKLQSEVLALRASKLQTGSAEKMLQEDADRWLKAWQTARDLITIDLGKKDNAQAKIDSALAEKNQKQYNDALAAVRKEHAAHLAEIDSKIAKKNDEIAKWRQKLIEKQTNQIQQEPSVTNTATTEILPAPIASSRLAPNSVSQSLPPIQTPVPALDSRPAVFYTVPSQPGVPVATVKKLLAGFAVEAALKNISTKDKSRSPKLFSQLPAIDQTLWASYERRARDFTDNGRTTIPRVELENLLNDVREFMADKKDFLAGWLLQARLALLLNRAPEGISAEINLYQLGARETGTPDILETLRQLDERGW